MPVVTVHLWAGRTVDQKRALCRAITDAMVEHADASPDALHVAICEYPLESWARGGVLAVDRTDHGDPAERPPAVWRLDHALLEVHDLEAAERFYVDTLGFSVAKRDRLADGRPLVVTRQKLGLTSGRSDGHGAVEHLAFSTRNVTKLAGELEARGVAIVDGPKPTAYGTSLYIEDLDNNKIEFFGPR